jgi:hypothetical protein
MANGKGNLGCELCKYSDPPFAYEKKECAYFINKKYHSHLNLVGI